MWCLSRTSQWRQLTMHWIWMKLKGTWKMMGKFRRKLHFLFQVGEIENVRKVFFVIFLMQFWSVQAEKRFIQSNLKAHLNSSVHPEMTAHFLVTCDRHNKWHLQDVYDPKLFVRQTNQKPHWFRKLSIVDFHFLFLSFECKQVTTNDKNVGQGRSIYQSQQLFSTKHFHIAPEVQYIQTTRWQKMCDQKINDFVIDLENFFRCWIVHKIVLTSVCARYFSFCVQFIIGWIEVSRPT